MSFMHGHVCLLTCMHACMQTMTMFYIVCFVTCHSCMAMFAFSHACMHAHHDHVLYRLLCYISFMHDHVCLLSQDGAAHRDLWHCKGESGTRMCMKCFALNHTRAAAVAIALVDPELVAVPLREEELRWCDDAQVTGTVRRLNTFHTIDNASTTHLVIASLWNDAISKFNMLDDFFLPRFKYLKFFTRSIFFQS